MPRQARCLADNQIYHIINRGNRRETIFHDSYDYEKFLQLLKCIRRPHSDTQPICSRTLSRCKLGRLADLHSDSFDNFRLDEILQARGQIYK